MVRLLREKSAFEMNLFGETGFLVSAQLFPYVYGLVGDRNPRQQLAPGKPSDYSPLARDAFEAIRDRGRLTKKQLREILGGALSPAALDRALGELWSRLRITRVEYTPGGGAAWDALYRWAPEQVRDGIDVSVPEALSVLISQFLAAAIAAELAEVEDFFSCFGPRSRVRDAVNAMLSAREFSFTPVGKKTMLQIAPRREKNLPRRNRPLSNRPISRRAPQR
jgi:23S rRNA pseudouridine2605 synthase